MDHQSQSTVTISPTGLLRKTRIPSERDVAELRSNAANIGFLGFVDTGIEGLKMTWRCEQFTYLETLLGVQVGVTVTLKWSFRFIW